VCVLSLPLSHIQTTIHILFFSISFQIIKSFGLCEVEVLKHLNIWNVGNLNNLKQSEGLIFLLELNFWKLYTYEKNESEVRNL
jgi:hypothetical protein